MFLAIFVCTSCAFNALIPTKPSNFALQHCHQNPLFTLRDSFKIRTRSVRNLRAKSLSAEETLELEEMTSKTWKLEPCVCLINIISTNDLAEKLKEIFKSYDKNRDGYLTMDEYNQWCRDTKRAIRVVTTERRFELFCKRIGSDPSKGLRFIFFCSKAAIFRSSAFDCQVKSCSFSIWMLYFGYCYRLIAARRAVPRRAHCLVCF